jgi:hypothetical protein
MTVVMIEPSWQACVALVVVIIVTVLFAAWLGQGKK